MRIPALGRIGVGHPLKPEPSRTRSLSTVFSELLRDLAVAEAKAGRPAERRRIDESDEIGETRV